MILSLELRASAAPGQPAAAAAWFLPGNSTHRWLEELACCGLTGVETRLFLVPRSLADRTPVGLLVLPGSAAVSSAPGGVACKVVAGRLYAPVDATLHPPVSDGELRALCPLPVAFFHPAFGLSGFEEESALRVSDLIERPEERGADWNFARPGEPPLPELTAIVLARQPTLEEVFGHAEREIGTEPTTDLPPAPDEPGQDALSKSRRNLNRWLAKGVAGLARRVPHRGSRRTWINDVEDWAHRQLRGVEDQLQRLRNKELHRLLHLLAKDPLAGLRHAIPMNCFAHRGLGPPGTQLAEHSLEFDPRRLGGKPADFWIVPLDLQERLRRCYREIADREMQLGRHRRAAYIYAELLGDLASAAHVLKQGRLFREAALLYEEHLQNRLEAACCLAEGGLLHEAIELYEKHGRWLEAAELHERLGNRTAAVAAVRRVVQERLLQDDIVGAAKLLDERLQSPEEALELLHRAWPSSKQAAVSVGVLFQFLARLGRHDTALERLVCLTREPVPDRLALPLLVALRDHVRDYPDQRVRHRAADFSRVLVASQLRRPDLPAEEAAPLTQCLVHLAPEDRLLVRDANRYLAERRTAELLARRASPPPKSGKQPSVLRVFELPRQIEWLQLRTEGHWFFALGAKPLSLTLLRGIWGGEFQSLSWNWPAGTVKRGVVFEPTMERGRAVALATLGGAPLAQQIFPAADMFFAQQCVAGTPAWLPSGFPLAMGEDAVWSVHMASGRAILSCHDKRGKLQRTIDVTDELLAGAAACPATPLCLAALPQGVALALGKRLVLTRGDGGLARFELPGRAVRLCATLPHTRQGIAVMLEVGAVFHWLGAEGFIELDRDLESPKAVFAPGGPLAILSDSRAVLFDVDAQGVCGVTRVELTMPRPVGISATDHPGQFAILGAGGEMTVYHLPR